MPQVTVGLMPNKVSYFCPETKINLTLQKPYATAHYETADQIKGIVKSLLSATPTLVYYDGEIPEEAIAAYVDTFAAANKAGKDRFVRDHATNLERTVPSNNVSVRADKLRAAVEEKTGGAVQGQSLAAGTYVPPAGPAPEEIKAAQEAKAAEEAKAGEVAPKTTAKRTTAKKAEEPAETK